MPLVLFCATPLVRMSSNGDCKALLRKYIMLGESGLVEPFVLEVSARFPLLRKSCHVVVTPVILDQGLTVSSTNSVSGHLRYGEKCSAAECCIDSQALGGGTLRARIGGGRATE
eukprot:4650464-Amphidinium_carterae.1